jgi:hypothetical protein
VSPFPLIAVARDGFSLADLPRGVVEPHLANQALVDVRSEWLAPLAGYHPDHASRRPMTPPSR